ncbi:MAG: hypothetical protein K6G48_06050, partial [Acholeplasmatales bacterium]|nr:hypothetical protein [Acholeplasmatales bacterium]
SLFQVIKVMLGRKIILACVTVGVAVLATLGILFGYNKISQTYSASYVYSNPTITSGAYADGTAFNYRSLTTETVLTTVKESDSSFSSIDISEIIDGDGIGITGNVVYDTDGVTILSTDYTITTKKRYFKNKSQAKSFIKALAEYPVTINTAIVESMTTDYYLDSYSNSNMYENMASYLLTQYEYLTEGYKNLIETYGDKVLTSGSSVTAAANKLTTYFKENSLEALDSEIKDNIYIYDYDATASTYETKYEHYLALYNSNANKIAILEDRVNTILASAGSSTVDLSEYYELIVKYTSENFEYYELIKYFGNILGKYETTDADYIEKATADENAAFKTVITGYYNKLVEFTETYTDIMEEVIDSNDSVYFNKTSVITENGGLSTLVAIAVSIVFGFVVACCTNLIIDRKKLVPASCECDSNNDVKKVDKDENEGE